MSKNFKLAILFYCLISILIMQEDRDCPEYFVENPQYPANGPECFPEEFLYYSSIQLAYYYFFEVTINDFMISDEDWVGAFNGDVCVGARRWGECNDGGGCDVPVLGNDGSGLTDGYMSNGLLPSYKIYDISQNEYIDATATSDIPWFPFASPQIALLYSYLDIEGCTDQFACNQDPYATIDDGSCEYCSCEIDPQIIYDWDINNDGVLDTYNNFENNGSITSNIVVDGINIISPGDMLAAFVDNQQRGVAVASEVPEFLGGGYAFLMMTYSNEISGEILSFKYYHAQTHRVYCLSETTEFISNMVLGDVLDPFVFSFSDDWLSSDVYPDNFKITSAYPNPFNPMITIEYSVENTSSVDFLFYDIRGTLVDKIEKGYLARGIYELVWENINLSSGPYFIVMTDGVDQHVIKVFLIK